MSVSGQSRRSDRVPMTSGLPPQADLFRDQRHVSKVPDSDGGAVLCAEPSLTHLKGDDGTSRRPTCRYRAAKLIRETANNELSAKS
jgi:hypothetical protein